MMRRWIWILFGVVAPIAGGLPAEATEPAVAIETGVITHGEQIPLPTYPDGSGSSQDECVWAVFPRTVNPGHERVYAFRHKADGTRVAELHQITLHGTFRDLTGIYLIIAVRGYGGAEVAIADGYARHGDTLPLPVYHDGSTASPADCSWIVTPQAVPTGYNALLGFDCWANANRVVTMRHYSYTGTQFDSWVSYLVLAVRPDSEWQFAAKAEPQPHGGNVTFPDLPMAGEVLATGLLTGARSFASGHDAMLGFGIRVDSDMTQIVRQTTIAGGGSDFYDSWADTITLTSGLGGPVSMAQESWGRLKGRYHLR
jgi:hypothetical protein